MRPEERAKAEKAVHQAAENAGYEVLGLTISNDRHLCLTLDADPGPITMDDCTTMNHRVRQALARAGLAVDTYAVEVQSPGVRRPLLTPRHYQRFLGAKARVRLREPLVDGTRVIRGTIAGLSGDRILLERGKGEPVALSLEEIQECHLDPESRS